MISFPMVVYYILHLQRPEYAVNSCISTHFHSTHSVLLIVPLIYPQPVHITAATTYGDDELKKGHIHHDVGPFTDSGICWYT